MKTYFSQYRWKNSTLSDFIKCFSEQLKAANCKIDLDRFKIDFLCTAGMNSVIPIWTKESHVDKSKLVIKQSYASEAYKLLRQHSI